MTDAEIVILYAKDRLVRLCGFSILAYSLKAWNNAIMNILDNTQSEDVPGILLQYKGE